MTDPYWYSHLSEENRTLFLQYIPVKISWSNYQEAWEWLSTQIEGWGGGKSFHELHEKDLPVRGTVILHFEASDRDIAMLVKLKWGSSNE